MSQPAATTQAPKRRATRLNELSVERVAKVAAEMTRRHLACFNHLTALAKSVERYNPQSRSGKAKDCVKLAQQLVECADQFRKRAEADDLAFSIVATDNLCILDEDVRNTTLNLQPKPARKTRAQTVA